MSSCSCVTPSSFSLLSASFVILGNVGVLFLQRRDGALAEIHVGRGRRDFLGRQSFRLVLARSGRRRLAHVLESGDDRVLVALHHLHHVGAHVLGFLVALEVVDVFDLFAERFPRAMPGTSACLCSRRPPARDGR